jgi:DNA mismatch repair protein MutS2
MHTGALRALEFDRIVTAVTSLTVTPTGEARLAELRPISDPGRVMTAQRATTEGVRFLGDGAGFPLRAPTDLNAVLDGLSVEGRALESLRLLALADYLESIEQARGLIKGATGSFPLLGGLVEAVASFRQEIADVRRKIDPSGEVADNASPALNTIRDRLRKQKQRLRNTLESFLRGKETAKYLQEQVVTDRNGRYVLIVRAEHRAAIPGIIHGASTSGASLFLEPLSTVEINNDIVALEEQETAEVRRILLALTDAFRHRPVELRRTIDVATELDVIQAKARFAQIVDGIEPVIVTDGTFELRGARHPLLIRKVNERLEDARPERSGPVPVDILVIPPTNVLLITGPNTGGKTVALKTAGLLAAMAQAGLHVPAEHGSRLPVFRSIFADIGDEQSISASLSTFSAHITNVVAMDRELALPALVLLDEVGAGTDPVEGGALGIAVIDHLRRRGAHLIATTHYDSLKSYASMTTGVAGAAFGFDAESFAPTYRLVYGSPGRSLAIEIAARLGMPRTIIAAARENLGEREKQLSEHLAKVDSDLRRLEHERLTVARERENLAESEQHLRTREDAVRGREEAFRRRLNEQLDRYMREARHEIDAVIGSLKERAAELTAQAARQVPSDKPGALITTGDTGAVRAEAREALERVVERLKDVREEPASEAPHARDESAQVAAGAHVALGGLGIEGTVIQVHDGYAEVDVRGKRLRTTVRDLRVLSPASAVPARSANVRVNIDLQPRQGTTSDLNVIGCTVEEALSRADKFLDESTVTEQRTVRLIHGYGTGQLRRALAEFLKSHPLVARFELAPPEQGGGGVTVVELKD